MKPLHFIVTAVCISSELFLSSFSASLPVILRSYKQGKPLSRTSWKDKCPGSGRNRVNFPKDLAQDRDIPYGEGVVVGEKKQNYDIHSTILL